MSSGEPAPVVHLVDDDPAVRHSLGRLLRARGRAVEEHELAEAFLDAVAGGRAPLPGCAILDIRMPGMDGLALQRALAGLGAELPVVFVTGHADVPLAVEAMRAGAVDFVEKPYDPARILDAIGRALALSADASGRARMEREAVERIARLSPREREVLDLLVAGLPNKLIAHRLELSVRTVEAYRATMMEKLGAGNLSEAVRVALAGGVAAPPPRPQPREA